MKKCFLLLAASSWFNLEANLAAKISPAYNAFVAYGDKNFTTAESVYAQNLEADPYDMVANYNLGTTLYKQNKFAEAKHHFERSVKSVAGNDSLLQRSLFNLGNSCMQLAEYQQAIDAYEKVLELSPNDERAQKNLDLARALLEEQNRKKEEEEKKDKDSDKDCDKQKDQQKENQDKNQNQGKDKPENKPGKKDKKDSQQKDDNQQQDKSNGNDQKDSNQQNQKNKETGNQADNEEQGQSSQNKSDQKDSRGERQDQELDKEDSESADAQQDKKKQSEQQDSSSKENNMDEKKDQNLQKSKEEQGLAKEADKQDDSKEELLDNAAGAEEKKNGLQDQYAAQMNANPGVDDRLNERESIVLKALSDQENAIQKQLLRMNVSKEGVKHEKNW